MRISKIIVKNYRSIKNAEVEISDFSIFVGQNNHGKTNFFEAIEWFYNSKSSKDDEYFQKNKSNIISVEVFFENVQELDIGKLKTQANQTKVRSLIEGETTFSVLKKSSDHKRNYIVRGENKGNPSGIDSAINEFLPKLEYINTKIRLDDVSSYKTKNPIGTMLSGVLATIIENSQEYSDFKSKFSALFENDESEVRKELDVLGNRVGIYLQKQFPDGTSVKFTVNSPEFNDLLKNFETTVNDGFETKAEDKGDGMQRAIMLSIIQAFADYRKEQSGGGNFLFLIDEAELHLHPSAQRALKNALLDISKTDQVCINTHSSVLVVDENEAQKIFKVEKTNKISELDQIGINEKVDVIFDLLGGSPSDLLLPRNFMIVEGRSEYYFINTLIKRFYSERFDNIKILYAGGDLTVQEPTLLAVHRLFIPLVESSNPIYKHKTIVLLDKPNDSQKSLYDKFKAEYPYLFTDGQIFELTSETLEMYYPDEYKKTKDEITSEEKVEYARKVASEISKELFEEKMPSIFLALEAANEKGFNPR